MKRIFVFLFIVGAFLSPAHSKTSSEYERDTVKVRCLYRQRCVMDTLKPNKRIEDQMLLDMGDHFSKYHCYREYLSDSVTLILAAQNKTAQEIYDGTKQYRGSRVMNFTIFKDYPQKGRLTLCDYFGYEYILYEETLPVFDWTLTKDTLTVCGYLCKKATTTFRGRNYEAWYSTEIPISDGPWKFNGLPGLILKAKDDQSFFSFVCVAVETPKDIKPLEFKKLSDSRMVSKKDFDNAKQRFMDNRGAYVTGNPLAQPDMPAHNYEKRPYNPIERTEK
jgi:GLPGLI family protein